MMYDHQPLYHTIPYHTGIRIIESRFRSSDHLRGDSNEAPVVVHDCFTEQEVRDLSMLAGVKSVMSMGSVLSIELQQTSYTSLSTATIASNPGVVASNKSVSFATDRMPTVTTTSKAADQHSVDEIGTLMIMESVTSSFTDIHKDNNGDGTSNNSSIYDHPSSEAPPLTTETETLYSVNNAINLVTLLRQERIYARPLGNTVYLMPTPLTPLADRQRLVRVLRRCIIKAFYIRSTNRKASTVIV